MKTQFASLQFRRIVTLLFIGLWFLSACSVAARPADTTDLSGSDMLLTGQDQQISLRSSNSDSALQAQPTTDCFAGGCHASLKAKQKQFVHTPFANGECQSCHTADHTDSAWTVERSLALCYSCHPAETLANSHPVGEGVLDPRTGETMTCLSCHETHSADHQDVLKMEGSGELCVACHTEFLQ